MSYRVIVKGDAPARLVDVECHNCRLLQEDVWKDEIDPRCPRCGIQGVVEVYRSAPMIDFRNTKPIKLAGVKRKFTSHREMERWAKENDKTVFPDAKDFESLPHDTPEERIERANGPKRREAIERVAYKLKHGTIKPVVHAPESEVLKEP